MEDDNLNLEVKEENNNLSVKDMIKKINTNLDDIKKNKPNKILLRSDKTKTVKQLVNEYEKKLKQKTEKE